MMLPTIPSSITNHVRIGRVQGTKEFVLADLPYFIAFRVKDGAVKILRVIHTFGDWSDLNRIRIYKPIYPSTFLKKEIGCIASFPVPC